MAKSGAAALLQFKIQKIIGFLNFTIVFLKKKNPIKVFIKNIVENAKEIALANKKLKKIQDAIIMEKYKYKKTELILAQNSDHFFVAGRKIDQRR